MTTIPSTMGDELNLSDKAVPIEISQNFAKYLLVLNTTFTKASTETPQEDAYDDAGAMRYVVAVILIYSSAVIGVFILGFFSRRHEQNVQIDEQANYFLKDIGQVRMNIERKQRMETIRTYSRSISLDPSLLSRHGETVKSGVLSMGEPAASLALKDADSRLVLVSSARGNVTETNGTAAVDLDSSIKRGHYEIVIDSEGKCLSDEKLCVPLLENHQNAKPDDGHDEIGTTSDTKADHFSRNKGNSYTKSKENSFDRMLNIPLLGNGNATADKTNTSIFHDPNI